jgi:hypothetical protein
LQAGGWDGGKLEDCKPKGDFSNNLETCQAQPLCNFISEATQVFAFLFALTFVKSFVQQAHICFLPHQDQKQLIGLLTHTAKGILGGSK